MDFEAGAESLASLNTNNTETIISEVRLDSELGCWPKHPCTQDDLRLVLLGSPSCHMLEKCLPFSHTVIFPDTTQGSTLTFLQGAHQEM
jgi:hypothetical protein